MTDPANTRRPHRRLLLPALALLAGAAAVSAWALWQRPTAESRSSADLLDAWARAGADNDLEAATRLNNRGVGLMERFAYKEALAVFEEVVRLAPAWLPGRINLGIAQLNDGGTSDKAVLARTRETFEQVLRLQPDSPHAHHCLGVLARYQEDQTEAIRHFEAVTRLDPDDPSAWLFLSLCHAEQEGGAERAEQCARNALRCDPYQVGALYRLALAERRRGSPKADQLLKRFEGLKAAEWGHPTAIKYSEMGRYGEVIGRREGTRAPTGPLPRFTVRPLAAKLAPGAEWASPTDKDHPLLGAVRRRFGGTAAVLDFDGDGRMDLFLAAAVREKGALRDLLLHNTPEGLVDVTAAAGLAGPHATLGCAAADYDNDHRVDLLLTGAAGARLLRNRGGGTFEDVTKAAGLDALTGAYLGAAWVDLDQDGDLDLVLAQYAPTSSDALQALAGGPGRAGRLEVWLNVGEAPPAVKDNAGPLGLKTRFRPHDLGPAAVRGHLTGVVFADSDGDGDLDLIALADRAAPAVLANDRLLRFRRLPGPGGEANYNGGLALDVTRGGRQALLNVTASAPPSLWLSRCGPGLADAAAARFEPGAVRSPPLAQAAAADLDLDGWPDVVGLSADRRPVLLHNDGGRLVERPDAFAGLRLPDGVLAAVPSVLDTKARPVRPLVVLWSREGLSVVEPAEMKNHGLLVQLVGRVGNEPAGASVRCNADGVGTRVVAQAGGHWAGAERVTLSTGLGHSRQPLLLGLGAHPRAEVVRLRWPDLTVQAELDLPAGLASVRQSNRKATSCPVLFAFDGERFRFVTDFLGAGTMGELLPDGSTRPPRPEESVAIPSDLLRPHRGRYRIDIAEPMDEVTYLDRLQLLVIDHPAGSRVFPDERFHAGGPPPTQRPVLFDRAVFAHNATDHRGRDVTATLRRWDRETVDGFARRAWLGLAEDHHVILDFRDRLAGVGKDERVYLCLAGWTDYPFPESIWAAGQAGVAMQPPILEREVQGHWVKVADAGFPAGLPRMMLLDVTGQLTGRTCKLRLRTNLQVFWDQAFVAVGAREACATALDVSSATLRACGLHQELSPDGRPPTVYAHDRHDNAPVVKLRGPMTRYGDVAELLRSTDDRFVVFGPGDLVSVEFDARGLPTLPPGAQRSYVLRTWGYCKDAGPFTAAGTTVGPLPYRAMKRYPPAPGEKGPDSPRYHDYLRHYQTRE